MKNPKYRLGELIVIEDEKGWRNKKKIYRQEVITEATYEDDKWIYETEKFDNLAEEKIIKSLGFPLYVKLSKGGEKDDDSQNIVDPVQLAVTGSIINLDNNPFTSL